MELQHIYLVTIAKIVDYCCNTSHYINLSDQEAFSILPKKLYFWQPVEENFRGKTLECKKNEILYVIETRFGIQFPNPSKKLLLENPSCTFEDVALAVHTIKLIQQAYLEPHTTESRVIPASQTSA